MKIIGQLLALAAPCLALASPALAAPYRFDVIDPSATQNGLPLDGDSYVFVTDGAPQPSPLGDNAFLVPVTLSYRVTYSPSSYSDYESQTVAQFYTDSFSGGYDLDTFSAFVGPQLFTGTVDDPTFLTGTFTYANNVTVTITAVPEPAAWGLMIPGMGAVGVTLRRRSGTAARLVRA